MVCRHCGETITPYEGRYADGEGYLNGEDGHKHDPPLDHDPNEQKGQN